MLLGEQYGQTRKQRMLSKPRQLVGKVLSRPIKMTIWLEHGSGAGRRQVGGHSRQATDQQLQVLQSRLVEHSHCLALRKEALTCSIFNPGFTDKDFPTTERSASKSFPATGAQWRWAPACSRPLCGSCWSCRGRFEPECCFDQLGWDNSHLAICIWTIGGQADSERSSAVCDEVQFRLRISFSSLRRWMH